MFDEKSENYWEICYHGAIPVPDQSEYKTSETT